MPWAYKWVQIEAYGRGWHDVLYWEYPTRWTQVRDDEVKSCLDRYYHDKEYFHATWDDVEKPPKEWLEKHLKRLRAKLKDTEATIERYEKLVKE